MGRSGRDLSCARFWCLCIHMALYVYSTRASLYDSGLANPISCGEMMFQRIRRWSWKHSFPLADFIGVSAQTAASAALDDPAAIQSSCASASVLRSALNTRRS